MLLRLNFWFSGINKFIKIKNLKMLYLIFFNLEFILEIKERRKYGTPTFGIDANLCKRNGWIIHRIESKWKYDNCIGEIEAFRKDQLIGKKYYPYLCWEATW